MVPLRVSGTPRHVRPVFYRLPRCIGDPTVLHKTRLQETFRGHLKTGEGPHKGWTDDSEVYGPSRPEGIQATKTTKGRKRGPSTRPRVSPVTSDGSHGSRVLRGTLGPGEDGTNATAPRHRPTGRHGRPRVRDPVTDGRWVDPTRRSDRNRQQYRRLRTSALDLNDGSSVTVVPTLLVPLYVGPSPSTGPDRDGSGTTPASGASVGCTGRTVGEYGTGPDRLQDTVPTPGS